MRAGVIAFSFFFFMMAVNEKGNQSLRASITYFAFQLDGVATAKIVAAKLIKGARSGKKDYALIEYEYIVNDVVYRNSLVSFKGGYDRVQESLAKYRVGSDHTVYFNEKWPSFSVLERSSLGLRVWSFPILIVFLSLVVAWVFKDKKKRGQSRVPEEEMGSE